MSRSHLGMRRAAAWLLILTCVGVQLVRQRASRQSPTDVPVPALVLARVLVGMKSLGIRPVAAPISDDSDAWSRLRNSILVGELSGSSDSLRGQLATLAATGGDVAHAAADLQHVYDAPGQSGDARARLARVDALGWFGTLAAAYALPDTDPRRTAAVMPARRAARITPILGAIALAGLVLGSVCALIALRRWWTGRLIAVLAATPSPAGAQAMLEMFAAYLASFLMFGKLVAGHGMAATAGFTLVLPLLVAIPRCAGINNRDLATLLGWSRGRGIAREIAAGIIGFLTGLPVIALGMAASLALSKVAAARPHPVAAEVLHGATIVPVLLACVWAPLVEETMFRGALFAALRSSWRWWPSTIIVSVLFAALHPQGLVAIPALTSIAIVLTGLRAWRGSLIAAMTAHALTNGMALGLLFLLIA